MHSQREVGTEKDTAHNSWKEQQGTLRIDRIECPSTRIGHSAVHVHFRKWRQTREELNMDWLGNQDEGWVSCVREETLVCDLFLLCLGKQYKRQEFDIAWSGLNRNRTGFSVQSCECFWNCETVPQMPPNPLLEQHKISLRYLKLKFENDWGVYK